MANPEGTQVHTLEQVLDSNLESVDKAEDAVMRESEVLGFDEDDLHKIGISVRECMVNAVVHGNRYNAKKKVHLKVERSADSIAIWIGDEGVGIFQVRIIHGMRPAEVFIESGSQHRASDKCAAEEI